MIDIKDFIEKELNQLAEKIFEDFRTRSYSAKLYSKILNNIISIFIEIRLDIFFKKMDIDKKVELKKFDFENIVGQLYDQLYHGKRNIESNDSKLENILINLLPSSEDILCITKYKGKEYNLDNLLQHIDTYGIQISRSDLIDYYHTKNSYRLSNKLSRKYKDLFSTLLTVYISLIESEFVCSDLPKRFNNAIKYRHGTEKMDYNQTTLHVESLILKLLYRTINKENSLIKTLYRFPDINQEIRNLEEFIQTNDLWKLDIIKPDFMLLKNGQRLDKEIKTKLNLIREIKADSSLAITGGALMLYFKSNRYLNENYKETLKIELQKTFEEWYYDPFVVEWENYWLDNKHRFLQNETINYYKPKVNSILKFGEGWEISYAGEKKIIKDLLGINYFSICLKSPGTELQYSSIIKSYLIKDLPMNQEIYDLYKNKQSIKGEIENCKTNYDEDPTYYEVELDKLETELKKIDIVLKKINLSSSGSTSSDRKNSENFTKACRKALEHCKEVFPKFYEHIKYYISWRNGKITYSGYLDWF